LFRRLNEKKAARHPALPYTPTKSSDDAAGALLALGGALLLGSLLFGDSSSKDDHSIAATTEDGNTIVVDDSKLTCLISHNEIENKQIPGCDPGKWSCWTTSNVPVTNRVYGKECRTDHSATNLAVIP
jgi:hypothetical protein